MLDYDEVVNRPTLHPRSPGGRNRAKGIVHDMLFEHIAAFVCMHNRCWPSYRDFMIVDHVACLHLCTPQSSDLLMSCELAGGSLIFKPCLLLVSVILSVFRHKLKFTPVRHIHFSH